MASLKEIAREYRDEIMDGIAWVAFWKQGRSWNAELFHLEVDGTLEPFDREPVRGNQKRLTPPPLS